MARRRRFSGAGAIALALWAGLVVGPVRAEGRSPVAADTARRVSEAGLRLEQAAAGGVRIETSRATGVARLVAFEPGAPDVLGAGAKALDPRARAASFLAEFGAVFGIRDASRELRHSATRTEALGSHLEYRQMHEGVPVFGAVLRVHVDTRGRVRAANGTFVPDLAVRTAARLTPVEAESIARRTVLEQLGAPAPLAAVSSGPFVYRTNLARGASGTDHLVFRVEVGDGAGIREFVFVDAHKGDVVAQITGIHDAAMLDRRVYVGGFGDANLVWVEGNAFPTGDADVNRVIAFTQDSFNMFGSLSGGSFLSWDAIGGTMHGVVASPGLSCPNAFWNGAYTGFCRGVTGDDTVAHEWGHAYTQSTHDLVYEWQPGALNEAYSDIWGEVVDLLNGEGSDAGGVRPENSCVIGQGRAPLDFEVTSPAAIAGPMFAAGALFNPPGPLSVSGLLAAGLDGVGTATDACEPLVGFPAGRIAVVDRGLCNFVTKASNAQNAGASGVVIVNTLGNSTSLMTGSGPFNIPSVMVGLADGLALRANLAEGVEATITLNVATETSLRWLQSEDSTAFGSAIRDLRNPRCFADPGKVSDGEYFCDVTDSGGVHTNSGVPNHGFALAVDGGSYNGLTVAGLGLTRAANIYWRAQAVYQTPLSGFPDHADALELACQDLVGAALYEPSAESAAATASLSTISELDCAELAEVIAAVELREPPVQCAFTPMLAPGAPEPCAGIGTPTEFRVDDWESGSAGWTAGRRAVADTATFDTPDWTVVSNLPDGRAGAAAFVADLRVGDCNDDTEAGVLFLESPDVVVPQGVGGPPRLAFDHWMSSELRYDGGNVKLSRNGGAWQLVPTAAFTFNPYPRALAVSDNPLGGEPAFNGADGGSVDGSWGQSQVNLAGLAWPGDTIRLRFEFGLDGCNGTVGWYVDDVRFYSCSCDGGGANEAPWFRDADGDGFGVPGTVVQSCAQPVGYVSRSTDCNDADPLINPAAPEACADGVNNDCSAATPDVGDADADGFSCLADCDDADPAAWAVPGEARELRFDDAQALVWLAPADAGGSSTFHDVLRSTTAMDFVGPDATCLVSTTAGTTAQDADAPAPGAAWFYLVRALNSCPGGDGTLGQASGGAERAGRSCP